MINSHEYSLIVLAEAEGNHSIITQFAYPEHGNGPDVVRETSVLSLGVTKKGQDYIRAYSHKQRAYRSFSVSKMSGLTSFIIKGRN